MNIILIPFVICGISIVGKIFLQGIPVVGAVGGIYDAVYMKRITEYANLKYKKRFLMQKKRQGK